MVFGEEEEAPPPRVEDVSIRTLSSDEANYQSSCKVMGNFPIQFSNYGNNCIYFQLRIEDNYD